MDCLVVVLIRPVIWKAQVSWPGCDAEPTASEPVVGKGRLHSGDVVNGFGVRTGARRLSSTKGSAWVHPMKRSLNRVAWRPGKQPVGIRGCSRAHKPVWCKQKAAEWRPNRNCLRAVCWNTCERDSVGLCLREKGTLVVPSREGDRLCC